MQHKLEKGFKLLQRGQVKEAEEICRKILAQQPDNPDALNLMGLLARQRGALVQSLQWFQKGLAKAPRHLHLLNSAGLVEQQLNNFKQAIENFKKALEIDPTYVYARCNLAGLLRSQRHYEAAKLLYRDVLKLDPDFTDALANLSAILEAEHQLDEARALARRALKTSPHHFVARQTLANIAARENEFGEVIELLLPLVQSVTLAPVDQALATGACAQAYDGIGDYEKAFEYFAAANGALREVYAQMSQLDSFNSPGSAQRIANAIPKFDFSTRPDSPHSPVFLVGFPRSGTSLLDQVLASHSQITVLEEKNNLSDTHFHFPATEQGLEKLRQASDAELEPLRQKYLQRLQQEVGADNRKPIVIDKLPLNSIGLLHISRLFPASKIIVALRDPRDSVLSCFQQRFDINLAMFQFLALDTAADYYDRVMRIVTGMRDTGALAMHFVKYESVVDDFRESVGAIAGFLGLEWEDSLADYRATAISRTVSTPSAAQVVQPLFTTSVGKWKHYRPWLKSDFEPLEKWVGEWGYEATDLIGKEQSGA